MAVSWASERERAFGIEELFFSTTDRKGRILDGNEVFLRVAGYQREEVIGHPHNVIRHPDMPRVVFRLLWEYLESGRPIAAYVKNRAKDGGFYWVLATARPIRNGFLSIRTKPCSEFFPAVRDLYVGMRAVEEEMEQDGRGRGAAMDASAVVLIGALEGLGYGSYDEFMRDVLATELRGRDLLLGGRGAVASGETELAEIGRCGAGLARHLDAMFEQLDGFRGLYRELTERSAGLAGLAEDVSLVALNGIIASKQLAVHVPALEAVASAMRDTCGLIAVDVRLLSAETGPATRGLGMIGFAIGMAKLQWEILSFVLQELSIADGDGSELDVHGTATVAFLADGLIDDVDAVTTGLVALDEVLRRLSERAQALGRDLRQLTAVELNGRVQSAAAGSPTAFTTLFDQVRERSEHAKELAGGIEKLLDTRGHVNVQDPTFRDAVATFTSHLDLLRHRGRDAHT